MPTPTTKQQPLKFEIKDGLVIISIGVGTMAFCSKVGLQSIGQWGKNIGAITHNEGFCREILRELQQEDETGATMFTDMMDKATLDAIDQGSQYVNHLHKGKIDIAGLTELAKWDEGASI